MKNLITFFVGGLLTVSAGLVAGAAIDGARGEVSPANAARAAKVTICHRTNSTTNPYRRITVSSNSLNRSNGHSRHDGLGSNQQYGPFNPSFTYPNNAKNWGDIIPGQTAGGSAFNGSNSIAQNWTTDGQAFLLDSGANRALCGKMTATEFYNVEVAAGTPESEILADLQDQAASDDEALKSACGGNLATCSISISSWTAAVSATTQAPTAVTGNGGTLNGELRCGTATTTKWYFEYSTDSTFTTGVTEAPSTPGSVTTNPQTVSQVVTGLGAGSYYYRLVCVTNYGDADNVGYLEGNVMILGVAVPYITTTSLVDGVTGTSYTQTILSDGGTAPRSNYLVSAGSLPTSLSLDPTTGVITGTPSVTGLFTFSITVRDSAGTPITSAPKQLTIRIRQPQTVTIPDPSPKNYGDAPFAIAATSNVTADNYGALGSFTSYSSSTTPVCTISNTGQITLFGAGSCTVSAAHSGNYLWDSGTGSRTFTVGTKAITVKAAPKSKIVNGTDPTPSYTLTVGALVGSDQISSVTYEYSGNGHSPVSAIPNIANLYTITPSAVAMSPGNVSNYTITYDTGVLTISATATAQTIDFADPADKTYGDAPFAITATSKDGGSNTNLEVVFTSQTTSICTVGTESLASGVTSVTVTALAKGTCTIEASQPGGSNGSTTYTAATPVTQSLEIAPKPLVITATDKTKVVDATNPTFTFTPSGLVGSDNVSSVTYTFSSSSYTASTTVPNVVGTFVIAPSAPVFSFGTASNYTISFVNGALTVTAAVVAPTTTVAPTTIAAPTTTTTAPSKSTDPRKTTTDPFANIKIEPKLNKSGGGGTLTIDGDPAMDVFGASSNDPTVVVEVTKSGVEYNKPETWVAEGFGDECWKIEPGTDTYTLPAIPQNPSGRGATYSLVKVKAGSLTSTDPSFQVNTVFMAPSPGSVVWPDSNKNGVIDSGGKNGDKQISHVILCVRYTVVTGVTSPNTTSPGTTGGSSTTVPGSATTSPGTTSSTSTVGTNTTLPKDAPDTDGKRDDIVIRLRTISVTGSTVPKNTVVTLRLSSAFEERTVQLTVNPNTMEVQKVVALSESKAAKVAVAIGSIDQRGVSASGELPATGSSGSTLMTYVLWLLSIGGVAVVLGRRSRRCVHEAARG